MRTKLLVCFIALLVTITAYAGTVNNLRAGNAGGASLSVANSWTAGQTFSAAGAASTPGLSVTGVPFAGTGTTSFPQLYVNSNTATASTTLNTAGTALGVNSHLTADLANFMVDGVSKFKVDLNGTITTTAGNINLVSGGAITNSGSVTQGYFAVNSAGPSVIHNIVDANPALIIQQSNTGSTGDILQLKGGAAGTTIVESTYKNGEKSFKGVVPTATTGCGTSPTIVGNNNVGHITVGATPGTTCLVTFANAGTGWGANAPVCTCNDDTSAVACRVSANSTTTITLNAVVVAADSLDFICVGYR